MTQQAALPPQDIEAEEALLGAILLSDVPLKRLIIDVGLYAEAFYRELHGKAWDAMIALAMRGERVDTLTLRTQMEAMGVDRKELHGRIEGWALVVPMASNIVQYARRVMETAEWRRVLDASYRLQEAAHTASSELRQEGEGLLLTARRGNADTRTPENLAEDVWNHLWGTPVPAWSTPWSMMNVAMGGGLRAGEVTLLGGWTSHGKSLITDQMLRHCVKQGARVHLYINEMSPTMRALRIVSSITSVPQFRLAQPSKLTDDDRKKVTKMLGDEGRLPFGITQVTNWTADDVARDIRFRNWDVCALDLVHRLPFEHERDLAQISSTLNAAAQSARTHLIAVVHLNEGRATSSVLPPPVLRDIRASGMLKNDADNVMFIHRKEEQQGENDAPIRTDEGSLYLAKCRNGELRGIPLVLDAKHSRFHELGQS